MTQELGTFSIKKRDGTSREYRVNLEREGEERPVLRIEAADNTPEKRDETITIVFDRGLFDEVGIHNVGVPVVWMEDKDYQGKLCEMLSLNYFEARSMKEKAEKLGKIQEAQRIINGVD